MADTRRQPSASAPSIDVTLERDEPDALLDLTIGQATGIVMERHRLSPTEAFDHLRQISSRHDVPLHELAAHVVAASTGRARRDD